LLQKGVRFNQSGTAYHLISRSKTINGVEWSFAFLTNVSGAIHTDYNKSQHELVLIFLCLFGISVVSTGAIAQSITEITRALSLRTKTGVPWWWAEQLESLMIALNEGWQKEDVYKLQIEQSTSGHVIVRSPADGATARMYSPNNAFCKITGYTKDEIEGQPLNLIVPSEHHHFHYGDGKYVEDRGRRVGMLAYAKGCPFHSSSASVVVQIDRTADLIHKDGSTRQVILGVEGGGWSPDKSYYQWFGVVTDVTELSQAKAQAEALAKDTQNITHIFAHDLKAGEIASSKAGEYITETGKDLIEYLKTAGHLDSNVERSLNFIVKYSGRITASCQNNYALIDQRNKLHNLAERLTPAACSIDEIFEGVRVSFNRTDGKLLFINECPADAKALVDITLFLAALKNLVKNGFAYNDSIDKQIQISAKVENSQILFSMTDNGVGFPSEYLENWGKIQGQAARLDPSKEGSGTGLFSVRRIIEAHKGASVAIESEQGVGSTFLIKVGMSK
jgi:signal transduction histidine kinase